MKMRNFYQNKRVLITGAAGTIGKEVVRQLLFFVPKEIRLIDNNEVGMFFIMEEHKNKNISFFLGDIRDKEKVDELCRGIDIIIHLAAFKHVILSEYNPFEAIQTNVIGLENLIRSAISNDVRNFLFTSSDKAVNPTNVMGASKLLGEKLVTSANAVRNAGKTIFSSVRFGNVLGSSGSVTPIFLKQIKKKGPVTLTDRSMTRFVMTIEEAAMMVLKSVVISRGGEVFVTKMPAVRIKDLAKVMIEILAPIYKHKAEDIRIVEVGSKPGEKLYEELLSDEEARRSSELKDMFVIMPAFTSLYDLVSYKYPETLKSPLRKSYVSSAEKPLTVSMLKRYFISNKVLEKIKNV